MIYDCELTEVSPGRWVCLECDPKGKLALPASLPRTCFANGIPRIDASPAARLAAILHELTQLRADQPDWHVYPARSHVEIERRLGRCFECNRFDGSRCTMMASDCKVRRRWLKALSCVGHRECVRWTDDAEFVPEGEDPHDQAHGDDR